MGYHIPAIIARAEGVSTNDRSYCAYCALALERNSEEYIALERNTEEHSNKLFLNRQ